MKRILAMAIVCILCFSILPAIVLQVNGDSLSWATKVSLPQPMAIMGVVAANGKVYAIGGQYQSETSLVWLNTNYEYDLVSDNWVSKASMPTKRATLAVVSINDKIYAIGGAASASGGVFSANEEFDPASNSWTTRAPMPIPRNWISAVAVNGKIYVMGGSDNSGGIFSNNQMYDTLTDIWTTKTQCPHARIAYGIGVVNGRIYMIGGWGYGGSTNLNEEYDPQTDSWTTKTPMPTARNSLAVAVVNNKIYAIGGATDFNPMTNNLNTVEEYDPSTDTWSTIQAMPTQRSMLGAVAVNNRIYSIGGMGSAGYLGVNEELSLPVPEIQLWMQWWFWTIIALGAIVVILGFTTVHYRKKPSVSKGGNDMQTKTAQRTNKVCPNCGANLPVDSKFCGNCGTSLE
jgi:N-acetylneuraminic acid mutarotase